MTEINDMERGVVLYWMQFVEKHPKTQRLLLFLLFLMCTKIVSLTSVKSQPVFNLMLRRDGQEVRQEETPGFGFGHSGF